jgi:uncharacterized membrane protein YhaH (DUF805 family)
MSFKDVWLAVDGRICRKDYWLKFIVPYLVLYAIVFGIQVALLGNFMDAANPSFQIPWLLLIFVLLMIYPSIAAGIKRVHDRNRSGWFLLLAFVPILNIWLMIELYFLPGTPGDNRFGPDPLAGQPR